jgi:class 3 adenylate cyclase/TolB-like protein
MVEKEIQRKIAVIFIADAVGYSQHMKRDEDETVKSFRSCKQILDRLFEEHDGRVFNTAGDSILAEFTSAVSALVCASEFQSLINERNKSENTKIKMEFRIGINMGDVVKEGKNLYGDGVNIAARLEALCQPAGISLSKSVYEFVNNKTKFLFNDLGEQKVKNESFHAFDVLLDPSQKRTIKSKSLSTLNFAIFLIIPIILLSLGTVYFLSRERAPSEIQIVEKIEKTIIGKTLLIKPLESRDGSEDIENLSKSITDHLISSISSSVLLNIVPTQLSYKLTDAGFSDSDIKLKYGVSFVFSGSIITSNDKFRVNLELVDLGNNNILSTINEEFDLNDLFGAQDILEKKARRAILSNLTIGEQAVRYYEKYFPDEEDFVQLMKLNVAQNKDGISWSKNHSEPYKRILEKNINNSAAHLLYARNLWRQLAVNRTNISADLKAIQSSIDKAIELDPANAPAYAVAAGFNAMRTQQPLDKVLIEKALNMGGDNSETISAVIGAYIWGNNHPKIIENIKKYFDIAPFGPTRFRLALLGSYIALSDNKAAKEVALNMVGADEFSDFWGELFLIFLEEKSGDQEMASTLYADFIAKNKTNNQDLINKIKSFPWGVEPWYIRNLVSSLKEIERRAKPKE